MIDRPSPEPRPMTSVNRPRRPQSPAIEFAASVHADELRFVKPPETDVCFIGDRGHESRSGSDRTNLPEQVEVGNTYRNVRVDYRLASRLANPALNPAGRECRERRNLGRGGWTAS